jgi:hypothetical protein
VLEEQLSDALFAYSKFELWFIKLSAWIESSKSHENNFNVEEVGTPRWVKGPNDSCHQQ